MLVDDYRNDVFEIFIAHRMAHWNNAYPIANRTEVL